jgi:hypothetical protein
MALQKFGDAESAEVFRGEEAKVVNDALAKTGKAVSEFDENELATLRAQLDAVREEEKAREEGDKPYVPADAPNANVADESVEEEEAPKAKAKK